MHYYLFWPLVVVPLVAFNWRPSQKAWLVLAAALTGLSLLSGVLLAFSAHTLLMTAGSVSGRQISVIWLSVGTCMLITNTTDSRGVRAGAAFLGAMLGIWVSFVPAVLFGCFFEMVAHGGCSLP
jgi:hypothetical protein